ncbi:hypothetical protein SADUNF_Sadunf01G0101400 [Salix dunnii]|uniref:C2H2-type domain-containing protein n=1 Tax=Salix dunnii TaxID=1413687 RepID=A0A835NAX3_9ROSI|nr:hypothetical protein SADUNF_Sadunf01G0101400 [Salix dunnii]
MEKTRICKICNRRFANGKAMGGHMRSHLAKLPLPPKPIPPRETYNTPKKSPPSSSSLNYPLLSNKPTQSPRSILKQKVSAVSKPTPYDGESETESTTKPTGRRSKRSSKSADDKAAESMVKVTESSEQVSSVSYLLAEEDVALCLLMLSRDEWSEDGKQVKKEVGEYKKDHQYVNEAESEGEKENYLFGDAPTKYKSQGKYKCETCKRGFRSYQALGGHRASHKRIKIHDEHEEGSGNGCGGEDNHRSNAGKRIFKCPLCEKVFDSGQALGGHKKVHFSYLPVANARISIDLLDLNIPALEVSADHDDGEVSEV